MATLNDLESEVRRLRRRLNELEGAPAAREQRELDQLLGTGEGWAPAHGGFAAACEESRNSERERTDELPRRD
jgi:hypothetical protein